MEEQGKISFAAAVLMSINIIVGAGIFFAPQSMAVVAGSSSFLGWPFVGLLMFPVVWGIAQASRIFPGAGGFYNYCAIGINPTFGFIAQWAYLLGYMGTAGTLITVLREGLIKNVGLVGIADYTFLFNAVVIVFFTLLNLISIELISKIQSSATLIKMLPLFFTIAVLAWYWNPTITYAAADVGNLGLTVPFAIFAFWGFEACCSLGHLLKGGPQQVGKVILTAFFISTVLYMLFHLGLIHIMGASALAAQGGAAFPNFMGLSPMITKVIGSAIVGSILLSFANSIFGVSLSNITNLYLLARNKLIIGGDILTKTNQQQRPTYSAFIHGVVLWGLVCIINTTNVWAALTNLGISTACALTLTALFVTYLKAKNFLQIFITILGFMSCSILIYFSWLSIGVDTVIRLLYAVPMVVGIILGLIMFKCQQAKTVTTTRPR